MIGSELTELKELKNMLKNYWLRTIV